jgi:pimeloyl-ACP methyl ester carboxylesterase
MLRHMKKYLALAILVLSCAASALAQSSAITVDPPADQANPATLYGFTIPSHGSQISVLAYVASGAGPHPAVVMLHGFPGDERNVDVAQAIRRAGYTVLISNYRGAWGSQGAFSFTHALEDSQAAVDYLRVPANARRLRIDADEIVLLGHSVGGWMALSTAAVDPKVRAVIVISAADIGGQAAKTLSGHELAPAMAYCIKAFSDGSLAGIAGTTPEVLCRELGEHGPQWAINHDVQGLVTRPVFLITSDDGYGPAVDEFAKALRAAGSKQVHEAHLATDHEYSDKRIALTQIVLDDLASLKLQ